MVTYYVEKDEIYKVSATVNCAVYDASGSTIATCDAGSIVTFKAPTDKILISDNNAALTCISESASGDLSGLTEHVNNSAIHVTAAEKAAWNSAVDAVTVDTATFAAHMENNTIHLTADTVESMLHEGLYTQGEYRTTYGSDNFNANVFEIGEPPMGEISQIALPCRSASGNVASMYVDGPVYLSVFEKDTSGSWQHIGTSTNSNTQTVGTTAYYQFDDLTLSGRAIRFTIVTDSSNTAFDGSLVIGARVTAAPDLGRAYTNATLTSTYEYIIDATFIGENVKEKYAPSSHVEDTNIHITADERAAWSGATESITSHVEDADVHVTADEKATWNDAPNQYAAKNLTTANAVVITDANGNITASTIISVSELNTLNNNLTNLATKLADLESRLAALETA